MEQTSLQYGKVIGIARAFAEDFALCYDMPELKEASKLDWTVNTKDNCIRCEAEIQPKGQISALVRSLHVSISFRQYDDIPLYYATVRLSYDHNSGGSNGHTDDYRVVTKNDIIGKAISYVGFIHRSLEYAAMIEQNEASKQVKA